MNASLPTNSTHNQFQVIRKYACQYSMLFSYFQYNFNVCSVCPKYDRLRKDGGLDDGTSF